MEEAASVNKNDSLLLEDLKVNKKDTNHERGWFEVKMTGKLPERRSY